MSYGEFLARLDSWVLMLLTPLSLAILISGLDDLLVDLVWAWTWLKTKLQPAASLFPPGPKQLESAPKARIAIFVPLWHEDKVIAPMLEHNLAAIRYPNYHFFCGCYPNDDATQAAVRGVSKRFPQVHLAVAPHDGPTSKADNLNWVYQHLELFEEESGIKFDIVMTHDAEDMIHPEELRWVNYYCARYDFVQTPVLALPTPIWEFTHGVYCDEFAEYHSRDMNVRAVLGGFVPGSGVGTGIRRDALQKLAAAANNQIFSPKALTEDYENGLDLFRLGCQQAFVPISAHGEGRGDFMATREFFPRSFKASWRQKTRWVMGIGLQGWEHFGWSGKPGEVYWLWRDRKGLIASPLSLLANLVFFYGLSTQLWERASMFAMHVAEATFAILMIRTAVRAGCVTRIYGWFFALGVPFRAVYGNVLNTAATVNAVVRYVIARVQGKPLKWLKTDHAYPGRAALLAHKRLLGEILVDSGRLTAAALKAALETQPEGKRLGEHLVATGRLNIESLYDALSFQQGLPIAEVEPREVARPLAHALPKRAVKKWQILPFGVQDGHLLLVSPEAPSNQLLEELRGLTRLETRFHLVTPAEFDRLTTALL